MSLSQNRELAIGIVEKAENGAVWRYVVYAMRDAGIPVREAVDVLLSLLEEGKLKYGPMFKLYKGVV